MILHITSTPRRVMAVIRKSQWIYPAGLLISLLFGSVIKEATSANQKVFGSLRLCPAGNKCSVDFYNESLRTKCI